MSCLNWSYLVNTAITGTRKTLHVDPKLIESRLDVPFSSGHISPIYFRSSDGRTLSIDTQYLKKRKRSGFAITNTKRNEPYRVQSIRQCPPLRPTTNKLLHNLQLLFITSFESSGVVKNITLVACEG